MKAQEIEQELMDAGIEIVHFQSASVFSLGPKRVAIHCANASKPLYAVYCFENADDYIDNVISVKVETYSYALALRAAQEYLEDDYSDA